MYLALSSQAITLFIQVITSPKAVSSILVDLVDDLLGQFQNAHIKG
jgi:hypothetical protein